MSAASDRAINGTQVSVDRVNAALDRYLKSISEGQADAVRHVALTALVKIQKATPVDTGRARAGWNAGVRAAGGTPLTARRKSVTALGVAIGNLEGTATVKETEERVEFTAINAVRYIPFLEAGASQQAPNGFVRIILDGMADDLVTAVKRIETEGTV